MIVIIKTKYHATEKHVDKLNLEGIVDIPTQVSQIPKPEKDFNLAINVYGYTVSKKKEKVNIFPYHISEQPKEMQRINLLLISEDVEVEDSEDEEGIIDDNYDPDADYIATEKKERNKISLLWHKESKQITLLPKQM